MEVINLLLSVTIFLIMVSVGSSIEPINLRDTFKRPKKLVLGLVLQVILFPIFAFLIASLSNLPVEYKIGLVILAACPGGTLSNFISYLVKGNTALSVGLTSTNSIVILLTIPIYISIAFITFLGKSVAVSPPVLNVLGTVSFLVILPVLIGSYIRYLKPQKTLRAQNILKVISSILLAVFFIVKFIGPEQIGGIALSKSIILSLLPRVLLLNVVGLFLGWGISKLYSLSDKISTTMGIEVGLQNTVLALVVTDVILMQPKLGHPALIYALFSFWTTLLFGIIMLEKNNQVFKRFKKHRTFSNLPWKRTLEK